MTRIPERWIPVIDDVCNKHRIGIKDIMSRTKLRNICYCRREIWSELNSRLGVNPAAIARAFERDGSTIHAGINRHRGVYRQKPPRNPPHTEEEIALVRKMYGSGHTDAEAAAALFKMTGRRVKPCGVAKLRSKIRLVKYDKLRRRDPSEQPSLASS